MAQLLGKDGIAKLTSLEAAFLILSAFYHDTGMVYKDEEKIGLLNDHDFNNYGKWRHST